MNNEDSSYTSKPFVGGGKTYELIVYNDKIVIPLAMKERTIS